MKTAIIIGTLLLASLVGIAADPVAASPVSDITGEVKECANVGAHGAIVTCGGVCIAVTINSYTYLCH